MAVEVDQAGQHDPPGVDHAHVVRRAVAQLGYRGAADHEPARVDRLVRRQQAAAQRERLIGRGARLALAALARPLAGIDLLGEHRRGVAALEIVLGSLGHRGRDVRCGPARP